jgi:DNA-binding transcriptional LysR family regulator
MTNIPTELLRTLVAVVDLRSFTKAAQSLGVTQPAVSAQIKRLQILLGGELFDKSAPGVTLTDKGDSVVGNARRLLSINDQILQLAYPVSSAPLRIGIPGELDVAGLPTALAECRRRWPHIRFNIRGQNSDMLLRDLGHGELDLVVAFTSSAPTVEARHHWTDDVVWVRGAAARLDPLGPVPLIAHDVTCLINRIAVSLLDQAGRDWELVVSALSAANLAAAVRAGLGVAVALRRLVDADQIVVDDETLPRLPQVACGVYVRDAADQEILTLLADSVARAIAPAGWQAECLN